MTVRAFERNAATFTTVVLGLLALVGVVSGAGVATSSFSYLAALTVVLAVGTFVLVRTTSRPVILYASVGVLLVSLGAAFAVA